MIFCGEERKSTRASLHGARHRRANCFALRGGDPNRGMGIKEKRHRGRGQTHIETTYRNAQTAGNCIDSFADAGMDSRCEQQQ